MNKFEMTISEFVKEAASLQEEELKLKIDADLLSKRQEPLSEDEEIAFVRREFQARKRGFGFNQKWHGFLKECGLSENFTLPELCQLVIKKAKESAIEIVR